MHKNDEVNISTWLPTYLPTIISLWYGCHQIWFVFGQLLLLYCYHHYLDFFYPFFRLLVATVMKIVTILVSMLLYVSFFSILIFALYKLSLIFHYYYNNCHFQPWWWWWIKTTCWMFHLFIKFYFSKSINFSFIRNHQYEGRGKNFIFNMAH